MVEYSKSSPVSTKAAGLNYQEIKSHSSLLSNERVAILFYLLDMSSIQLNQYYDEKNLINTKSILYQIYKNIRTLIRSNTPVRHALNLETKEPGVYTLDLAFDMVEKMITYCSFNGYTYKKCYIISQQLNFIEIIMRDVLQYFSYFYRPEFKQKPDIEVATERYKEMADYKTIEQLKTIMGKNNKIDFRHLGKVDPAQITSQSEDDIDDDDDDNEYADEESELEKAQRERQEIAV